MSLSNSYTVGNSNMNTIRSALFWGLFEGLGDSLDGFAESWNKQCACSVSVQTDDFFFSLLLVVFAI